MTRLPADHAVRQRIETDLGSTLIIEAAAGTGKTTALVGRIVALVGTGTARLERIIAVTFTEKAAGEMKLRLRAALEAARQKAPQGPRSRFDTALQELEAMRIGTIHGLCADLLRERPVEARIDPLFTVAAEDEAQRLFDQAFESWFQRVLGDPPEGVRRILRRDARREEDKPRSLLRRAGWDLVESRDFPGAWTRPPFDRNAAIDGFLYDLFDLVALYDKAAHRQDYLAQQIAKLKRWADELRHQERVGARDHDGIEASLRGLRSTYDYKWSWSGSQRLREFGEGIARADVIARRDALKARLDTLVEACEMDLAPALREELRPLVAGYEAAKERAGRLDFHDLLQKTRDLLVRSAGVRADLQSRFSHLLVDEFQDTDPLQTEILLLLAADDPGTSDPARARVIPGKLFLVGDPKQSVYRFRRADVAFYHRVVARLSEQGAETLPLSTSFRGDPRIQSVINASFAPRMQGGTQAHYVALDPWRSVTPGRPSVVALSLTDLYDDRGEVRNRVIDESLPHAVAGWIQWLVRDSGWTVQEPGRDEQVPVDARHVCLLFKRFRSFDRSVTLPYTQALEARGIAHALVGGRTFHDREEVLAVRTALAAIEWPDDELSVFATLKGPLFAVPDDALLAWHEQVGRLNPIGNPTAVLEPIHQEVAQALGVLAELHRGRNHRPIADTVHGLLQATRAHAGMASWVAGEQVLANVLRLAQLARRFEALGATSFRAFLDQLATEARRGEVGEAPVVEEGTEGVRIMTIHGAKGLEFPIVVLCDVTCPPTWERPTRWVDPDRGVWASTLAGCLPADVRDHADEVLRLDAEEADRLLYVASTRARDVLVVPASADEPLPDPWTGPLHAALYPLGTERPNAVEAPGCPPFGTNATPWRPGGVSPGLHTSSGHEVVWWDPQTLPPKPRKAVGLRNQDLLVEDAEGRSAKSLKEHARWTGARTTRLADGARPALVVRTPTDLAHEAVGQVPIFHAVRVERTDVPRTGRPHGKRFGILVHAVLADVPLDADADAIARSAALHGRLVGAPEPEVLAAAVAASGALRHDLLRRAAASPDCRREVPLVVRGPDGSLVEGTADLAFLDQSTQRWVVVDFKTDVELEALKAAYEVQLSWYIKAIREATNSPADGFLLQV